MTPEAKAIKAIWNKAYRATNRERLVAKSKIYYAAHRKEHAANHLIYYAAHREELRAYSKSRYAAHREEDLARSKAYHAAHREERHAYNKLWRALHPDYGRDYGTAHREKIAARSKAYRAARRKEHAAYARARTHKISVDEYDAMLTKQGGSCAICRKAEWNSKGPNIDHDHKTGKVRGILCYKCNTALGMAEDDPNIIRAMLGYLDEAKIQAELEMRG